MSSYYDDDRPPTQGRARIPGPGPGPGGGHGPGHGAGNGHGPANGHGPGGGYDPGESYGRAHDPYDSYDPPSSYSPDRYDDPVPTGRATVGRAPAGAPGPVANPGGGPSFGGRVPPGGGQSFGGRASVGRATVRPSSFDDSLDSGFDPFDDSSGRPAMGPSGASGRATVGRASVMDPEAPIDPEVLPGGEDPDGPDGLRGRFGFGRSGKKPASKKTKRRRRILAAVAVLIMLTGIGIIGTVYYSSTIALPQAILVPQSTTIYYSDNKHIMARLGEQNRVIIGKDQITPVVKQAVIATEDLSFYSNSGVDFKGIARAFVNNVTGGDTQGASTITQQYARAVAGLTQAESYSRKIKEIVLAIKINNNMSKDDILTAYLNTVLFGRGAYGIEAAAEAYFGVHAQQLQANQAMVLAGLIKNPNGNVYDPFCNEKGTGPCQTALDRFNYTKSQMKLVDLRAGFLTPDKVDALTYPTNALKPHNDLAANALASPAGFIVHHVMDELSHAKKSDGSLVFPTTGNYSLKYGSYRIVTTIDYNAEMAAIKAAGAFDPLTGKPDKTSPMYGMPKGEGAALVSVQPGSGNVIAYYGGANGNNLDFGGIYNDPVWGDGHTTTESVTPGSSFKTITTAAALRQGISVNSYWWGPNVRTFPDRAAPLHNAGHEACPGVGNVCTMAKALADSLNTVYYAIGEDKAHGMSPAKVIDMAYDLGIRYLWSQDKCQGKMFTLNGSNGKDIWPACVGGEVSFGQYNIVLQDMANVMASLANHGVRADEHFVNYVMTADGTSQTPVYRTSTKLTPVPGLTPNMVDDETWAMQQVYKNSDEQDNQLDNHRPAAVKTGTWQLGDTKFTSSGFFNGFTAGDSKTNGQIATSVWVGFTGQQMKVVDQRGRNVAGASVPAAVWAKYMNAYLNNGPHGRPWPIAQFAPFQGTGDPGFGETSSPTPSLPPVPSQDPCAFPNICIPTGPPTGSPPPSQPPTTPPTGGGGGGGTGTPTCNPIFPKCQTKHP